MNAYRAALLYFGSDGQAVHESDGLLLTTADAQGVQVVKEVGAWQALRQRYAHLPVQHFPGRLIAPGFVDMHIHFPQVDVIGSPAEGLLAWLENYTFAQEARFAQAEHAHELAQVFLDELQRHGVSTALAG